MLQASPGSRKERSQKTADALPENTAAGATHAVTCGTTVSEAGKGQLESDHSGQAFSS